jgi:hypothetical protein
MIPLFSDGFSVAFRVSVRREPTLAGNYAAPSFARLTDFDPLSAQTALLRLSRAA